MADRQAVVFNLKDAPTWEMRFGRGTRHKIFAEHNGASNVDVHINVINVGSGPGPYHYHANAENIYIVLEGTVEACVEGKRYLLHKDDAAFIPPGFRHYAGNAGDTPARVIEIYAPAGDDFHIVDDPTEIEDLTF